MGETPPASAGGKHDARDWQERIEHRNSNEMAAQAIAGRILSRHLTQEELEIAAPVLHFAFGAAVGAIYGAYSERVRGDGARSGMGLGTALWLTADEVAMPVMGLSAPTIQRPLEMHLQSFAAHIVFGVVGELVRKRIRATL